MPIGTLRIGKSRGCVQYYHCFPNGPCEGKYIPQKDRNLASQLAQKSYDERVLKCADKRLSQINRILKDYEDDEIEQIFLNEHLERQKLIVPVEPTYQQMLEEWLARPYEEMGFRAGSPVILTNNGLRVRSKSEKIMADYFDSMGIKYKYECPIYLEPYGNIFPDFTFLSRKTGQEIYWEHEGMMDNPEYAQTAVRKIELYEMNGIYQGEQLILTFESSMSVLNTTLLQSLTRKYLL